MGGHRVYPVIITVATYGVVALIILSYFVGGPPLVSRLWLVSSWTFAVLGLCSNRLLWRRLALRWRNRGMLTRRVLIAGANRHGIAVAEQLSAPRRREVSVLGFLDDYQRPGTEMVPGIRVLGHPTSVLDVAKAQSAEEVIIIAGALAWESQQHLAELVTRPDSPIVAHISPTYYDLLTTSAELSHVAYIPVLTLHRTRLSGMNAFVKTCMDRVLSIMALVFAMPLLAWWKWRATQRGIPLLISDRAFGMCAQEIVVYGLNPDLGVSAVLGRLPALVNVLRGDLSLVGPCPVRGGEQSRYERWLTNLLSMRPGLTGLWRFRSEDLPVDERVALDLYYIRNYTFALDVQILLNTFRQLARRFFGVEDELTRWIISSPEHTPHEKPQMAMSATSESSHVGAAGAKAADNHLNDVRVG
jgi:lipopolysaccharide/colanic/teichoic acid biosynthesis glycosyltransferase